MQKAELELIIETIPDAVAVVDYSGNITYANRAAEIMLGLSRSEIQARTYNAPNWKITTPEGKPFPEEELPFVRVMQSKKPVYGVEHAIEHPDGKRVILSINSAPMLDEKGNIDSVVNSLTDITKRKTLELALRDSEKRFRELLEEINLVAVILDISGNITFANDYFLYLTDRTWASVIGKSFFNILVANNHKEEVKQQVFDSLAERKAPERYTIDIETMEGEHHIVSFSSVIVRDIEGEVAGIASIGEDVTEQRRAAEDIRESRKQVLDILESITDGFYALDNDWRFTYVNRRAVELIGIKRENLLFRNIWQVIPREGAPDSYEEYHLAKQQMKPISFEEFVPQFNRWLDINTYPYENGLSVYFRDITERKQAEEGLHRLNRELRAISNCNQVLMRAADEQTLLNDICRIICDEAGYRMAWVGYAEHDEAKTVRPVAWAGFEDAYLATASITWADTERGRGPSGTAIRSGQSSHIQDFAVDLRAAPWRESALQHGYRSSIALPLKDENANTFGILCIYSSEPNAFTQDEIRLLEELAGDLGFGITVLRNRVERMRAEERINQQLNELQRWYDVTLNREERVLELKREVNQLLAQLDRPVRYPSQK